MADLTKDEIILLSLAAPQVVTHSWSSKDDNIVAATKLEAKGYLRHIEGFDDPMGSEKNVWEITREGMKAKCATPPE